MNYAPPILIIEDEPAVRHFLVRALGDAGYAVTAVGTAGQARQMIDNVDFEVIIVDMSLPDADGVDLVRQIHSDIPYVQVLAISGMIVADLPRVVKLAGAGATLLKPVTSRTVRVAIQHLLRRRSEPIGIAAIA